MRCSSCLFYRPRRRSERGERNGWQSSSPPSAWCSRSWQDCDPGHSRFRGWSASTSPPRIGSPPLRHSLTPRWRLRGHSPTPSPEFDLLTCRASSWPSCSAPSRLLCSPLGCSLEGSLIHRCRIKFRRVPLSFDKSTIHDRFAPHYGHQVDRTLIPEAATLEI